jgi:hypothetical protein
VLRWWEGIIIFGVPQSANALLPSRPVKWRAGGRRMVGVGGSLLAATCNRHHRISFGNADLAIRKTNYCCCPPPACEYSGAGEAIFVCFFFCYVLSTMIVDSLVVWDATSLRGRTGGKVVTGLRRRKRTSHLAWNGARLALVVECLCVEFLGGDNERSRGCSCNDTNLGERGGREGEGKRLTDNARHSPPHATLSAERLGMCWMRGGCGS